MFNRRIKIQSLLFLIVVGSHLPTVNAQTPVNVRAQEKVAATAQPSESSVLIEGFTEPYADIDLAASEMGPLASVSVKEGDHVKAGQVLANLDDAVLKASLEVAGAGMRAEGELQSARTQLELRRIEQKKLQDLFERNHASQQELDRVSGEVRIAEARVQSVLEDLQVRRLEFARIEAQLRQRQIVSPIEGIVADLRKDCGEFVSPSDPVVARIVQLNPLRVVFSVPLAQRDQIKAGQTVAMQIGEGNGAGVIEHVSPTADPSSGTFRIKVRLPNPDQQWHGGEKSVLLLGAAPSALAYRPQEPR